MNDEKMMKDEVFILINMSLFQAPVFNQRYFHTSAFR